MTDDAVLAEVIRSTLDDREIEFEEAQPGAFLCKLPGSHKLATMTWLVIGEHSLHVEAFFVRKPDENHEAFYRWLLTRNSRLPGIAFALDQVGDVYLVGRVPVEGVTTQTVDRLLGAVLSVADSSFNELLTLGFLESMKREWKWRVERGESTRNLEAFRSLLERAD